MIPSIHSALLPHHAPQHVFAPEFSQRLLCILVILSASSLSSLRPCRHLLCRPSVLSLVSCVLVVTAVPCAKDLCSCLCLCRRVSSGVPGHCTTLNPPSLATSPPLSLPVLLTTPPWKSVSSPLAPVKGRQRSCTHHSLSLISVTPQQLV